MLSAPAVDLTFDGDEWKTPPLAARFYRAASVGSWGVTSIGRGFDWNENSDEQKPQLDSPQYSPCAELEFTPKLGDSLHGRKHNNAFIDKSPITRTLTLTPPTAISLRMPFATAQTQEHPFVVSPVQSRPSSPRPPSLAGSIGSVRPPPSRSPSSPRPRRRSSRQRVSLIAGRVLIAPIEPPSPTLPQSLRRSSSSASFLSTAASTRAPSPAADKESFLGGRSISDFSIDGEIGRGAYGLVKRAREIYADGSLGVCSSND